MICRRHLTDEVDDYGDLEVCAHLNLLHDPGVLLHELAGGVVRPLSPHPIPSTETTRVVWRIYRLKIDIDSIYINFWLSLDGSDLRLEI